MDLRSENPFWLLKNGLLNTYPSLEENIDCEVLVIGAGITGALCGWHLAQAGLDVVLVDRRHAGFGSTSASTALLQYEIDTPLYELSELIGEKNAVKSYLMCLDAIYKIKDIAEQLGDDTFCLKPSFQYSSFKKDEETTEQEYKIRKKHGFKVDLLGPDDIKKMFGFESVNGLYSEDGAQVDPFHLTYKLLDTITKKGGRVYDSTSVTNLTTGGKSAELMTERGKKIKAKHVVIAAGYESQRYLQEEVEILKSSYVIVSEPFVPVKEFWHENALIWETAHPYLYMRTTDDHRILVGGLDDDFYNPKKRDAALNKKSRQLHEKFMKLFPGSVFKTDFSWAGTFTETKDGLPYIGQVNYLPNCWFALGFGGNGITFSLIAAEMITEAIVKNKANIPPFFGFDR